jgi:hypothetical protein
MSSRLAARRVSRASGRKSAAPSPEVMRFLGGSVVPSEQHRAVIEKWLRRWEQDLVGPFVIERRGDGRFLGRSGILVWDSRTWTHTTITEARSFAQPDLAGRSSEPSGEMATRPRQLVPCATGRVGTGTSPG